MNKFKAFKALSGEVALVFLIALGWAAMSGIEDVVLGLLQVNVNFLPLNLYMLSTLYFEGIAVVAMLIRYRHRSLLLGISTGRRDARHEYILGLTMGGAVFTLIWVLIVIQGGYEPRIIFKMSHLWLFILYLFGFMIQSLLEEMVCRGYVMGYWIARGHVGVSIFLNALFFMGLHVANPGFNHAAALGIFLFGILMSLLRLYRGSIWMGAGFHAMWNFFEGVVFGTAVSGLPNIGLIFKSVSNADRQWISGGVFGLESSPTSIVVHVAVIVVMLIVFQQKSFKSIFGK